MSWLRTTALAGLCYAAALVAAHAQYIPGAPGSGGGGGGGSPGGSTNAVQLNAGGGNFGGVSLATGKLIIGQSSGTPAAETMSGDCTIAAAGAITCLDTNGTAFGTFATQNYAAPPVIGGTTPNNATFANLTVTGTCTGCGGGGGGSPGGSPNAIQTNAGGGSFGGVSLTAGQLLVGQSGAALAKTLSGDCTLSSAGAITCLDTNGVAFGTAATVNTGTTSGTVPLLGSGGLLSVGVMPAGVALLSAAQSFSAAQGVTPATLTDGATITPVFSASNNFAVTLGGNRTLANPSSGIVAGNSYHIIVTQDGTGGRTLAYGSDYKWPGGTAPSLSTAAGAIDMISCYVADTTHFLCGAALNFQ